MLLRADGRQRLLNNICAEVLHIITGRVPSNAGPSNFAACPSSRDEEAEKSSCTLHVFYCPGNRTFDKIV